MCKLVYDLMTVILMKFRITGLFFLIIILSETIMGSTHPHAIKPLFKPALLFIEIILIQSHSL